MPEFRSLQMTAPRHPVSGPGMGGRSLHVMRGEFTLTGSLAINDTIRMLRLHPRFRVLNGFIKTTGLGAGVTVALGDAADDDRYFTAASAAAAGTNTTMAETGRDYLNPRYEDVILKVAGAATGTSGTITVVLYGTVEEPA